MEREREKEKGEGGERMRKGGRIEERKGGGREKRRERKKVGRGRRREGRVEGRGRRRREGHSHIKDRLPPNTYRGIDCQVIRDRHLCRRLIKVIITLKEFIIIVLNIRPRVIAVRDGRGFVF